MSDILARLYHSLGYTFSQPALLQQALTHRSFGIPHNERLEFLGDAILDLVIGEWLYRRFPDCSEGELSQLRASIVCGENLAAIAVDIELGHCLRLGGGEVHSGGRERQSILADALEALLAAVYLDGGMAACEKLVARLFASRLETLTATAGKDAKTRLQEWLQARRWQLPVYRLVGRTGQEHAALFTVACCIAELEFCVEAEGSNRKRAEQAAAALVLEQLEKRTAAGGSVPAKPRGSRRVDR